MMRPFGCAAVVLALLAGCALTPPVGPTPLPAPTASTPSAPPTTPAAPSPSPTPSASAAPDWQVGRGLAGVDVSAYQPTVDWARLASAGNRFAFIKASEGSVWSSPYFDSQRTGAQRAGLVVGAYHYARPSASSGAAQARHFMTHGGTWSPGGRTLPGALDLEFATSGDRCWGLTPRQLVAWVRDFNDTYAESQGPTVLIYTSAAFWKQCAADDDSLGQTNRLWLFDHAQRPGKLPKGWAQPTFWQRGVKAGLDRNVFFGTPDDLRSLAAMG